MLGSYGFPTEQVRRSWPPGLDSVLSKICTIGNAWPNHSTLKLRNIRQSPFLMLLNQIHVQDDGNGDDKLC